MAKAEKDFLLDIGMPLIVLLLMAGMGATCVTHQIKAALSNPYPMACGMFSQFILMPLVG